MKNIGNFVKQAQVMQAQMTKMQEELAVTSVTGSAGGGAVEITMNGKQLVEKVKIAPAAVDLGDLGMLEDLVATACNDAQRRIQELTQQRLSKITGGMQLPGMPF